MIENKYLLDAKIVLSHEGFEDGELENLRSQGVDTDDWNIMLFMEDPDDNILIKSNDRYSEEEYEPFDYYIQRLLSDSCGEPNWYRNIKFRGKVYALGVEHH